jgi:hypothetical protein
MNEEDEAFEDLAKRQGDWGMQGSRKHQIMRYAENVENKGTSMTDKEAMKLALDALETLMIEHGSIYEKAIAALKEALAQPEQEPVAWEQFYTTAPQRTWVDLSDEDIEECFTITPDLYLKRHIAQRISDKLKDKNA